MISLAIILDQEDFNKHRMFWQGSEWSDQQWQFQFAAEPSTWINYAHREETSL